MDLTPDEKQIVLHALSVAIAKETEILEQMDRNHIPNASMRERTQSLHQFDALRTKLQESAEFEHVSRKTPTPGGYGPRSEGKGAI